MAEEQPVPLMVIKAGRAFRREGTNMVDHSPSKGAIFLYKEECLLRLQWKSNPNERVEEVSFRSRLQIIYRLISDWYGYQDLLLFPGDASFVKVDNAPGGRTYVLKFSSSNQKHFVSVYIIDIVFI